MQEDKHTQGSGKCPSMEEEKAVCREEQETWLAKCLPSYYSVIASGSHSSLPLGYGTSVGSPSTHTRLSEYLLDISPSRRS